MPPTMLALLGSTVLPLDPVLPMPDGAVREEAPVQASLSALTAQATLGDEVGLRLEGEVVVLRGGPVLLDLGLAGLTLDAVTVSGETAGVIADAAGRWQLLADLPTGRHPLRIVGTLPAPASTIDLPLPAVPLTLSVLTGALSVEVVDGIALSARQIALPPTGRLAMTWKPEAPPPVRPRRLLAESALGLSVSEGGVEGRGEVRWRVLDGAVSSVDLQVQGPVEWLTVEGPAVAGHTLEGQTLTVDFREPQTDRFSAVLAFHSPTGALVVPEADRREGWVSVFLADDVMLKREEENLERVSPRQVPAWGRDLVSGKLQVSLHHRQAAPAQVLTTQQFSPLEAPATVVEKARYELAYVAHGRVMGRAQFQVRNDRGAWLWIDLPEGAQVLSARVAGRIAEPVQAGERLGIPLEKSIETLAGLISVPVEVAWLADGPRWDGGRNIALTVPSVGAPIIDAAVAVHLPPEHTMQRARGSARLVEAWTERLGGVVFGRGYHRDIVTQTGTTLNDLNDEERRRYQSRLRDEKTVRQQSAAQEQWNLAYAAYKENEFEQASALLSEALDLAPRHAPSRTLKRNLAVFFSDGPDTEQTRRIRALARARSGDLQREQQAHLSRAEQLLRDGDIDRAVLTYEDTLALTNELVRLEDRDVYVVKAQAEQLSETLEAARAEQLQRWEYEPETVEEMMALLREEQAIEAMLAAQADALHRPVEGGMSLEALLARRAELSAEIGDRIRERRETATTAIDAVVDVENAARGEVLTKEFLQRIPVGRSYQSAVQLVAGRFSPLISSYPERVFLISGPYDIARPHMPLTYSVGSFGGSARSSSSGVDPTRYFLSEADPMTAPASEALEEVTASRWVMLIPPVGERLEFEQQLLEADEPITLQIRYR